MSRHALILPKIERAKHHIKDLEVAAWSFLASSPYVVNTKRDQLTRKLIYYVASVREPPPSLAQIAGDAIQNLRSALDHLAYQLVLAGNGTPSRRTCFPIFETPEKCKAELRGKLEGMPEAAEKAIAEFKPYKGGNDLLWKLHSLNNIDKHRELIVVASRHVGSNIVGRYISRVLAERLPSIEIKMPGLSSIFCKSAQLRELKEGDALFVDVADAEPDERMQFAFEIAFVESKNSESEPQPLLKTLQQMSELVSRIVENFAVYLR
jgi:hypothetical protein